MKQISGTKRLVLGLSVIGMGVLLALPFRRTGQLQVATSGQSVDSHLSLGEGVPLQVPGQPAMARELASQPPLVPVEDEPQEDATETATQPGMVTLAPPPQLPDEYHPLFRPAASRQASMGHVVTSNSPVDTAPKPPKRHTIHDGETLASLAVRYLGDASRANEILEANRSVLDDPEVLPIGVPIVIPREPAETPSSVRKPSEQDIRKLVPLPALGLRRSH